MTRKNRSAQPIYKLADPAAGVGAECSSPPQEVAWEGGGKWRRSYLRPVEALGDGKSPLANLPREAWEGEPGEGTVRWGALEGARTRCQSHGRRCTRKRRENPSKNGENEMRQRNGPSTSPHRRKTTQQTMVARTPSQCSCDDAWSSFARCLSQPPSPGSRRSRTEERPVVSGSSG